MKNIFYELQKINSRYDLCNLCELFKFYEFCTLYELCMQVIWVELCKLHECFMNHLKSVEIAWNVIFVAFKNVEFFSWIYKYEKCKL